MKQEQNVQRGEPNGIQGQRLIIEIIEHRMDCIQQIHLKVDENQILEFIFEIDWLVKELGIEVVLGNAEIHIWAVPGFGSLLDETMPTEVCVIEVVQVFEVVVID